MWVEVLHLKLFNKHHPSNKVRHISTKHQTAQAKLKKFLFPLIFALWTNKQGCKSWDITVSASVCTQDTCSQSTYTKLSGLQSV
jgi:hypothetical protein